MLECENGKGMPFTMYGVFCLTIVPYSHDAEFYVYIVHFRVQSIKASPVLIACKMAELFAFFEGSTQLEQTIVTFASARK